jgi:hypothetical protein
LGIDGRGLCEELIDHNALIAGSFPLQCLLGDEYKDSDVDIFIKMKINTNEGMLLDNTLNYIQKDLSPIDKWIYAKYDIRTEHSPYILRDVLRSRKHILDNGTVINVIHVDTEGTLEEFIMNTFDLSICQTYFDGRILYYNDLTLTRDCFIANPPEKTGKVLKPYHAIVEKNVNHLFPEKWDKYHLSKIYPDMQKNLENRIKKYRQREFCIPR